MKLLVRKKTSYKANARKKKKVRIRKKIYGTAERPRLNIFRSARHMYAQVIDDSTGQTIVEASTVSLDGIAKKGSRDAAKAIGLEIAKRAKAKNITGVVFDRNGFLYHGRVQSLAEGAREGGLNF